jgi:hypothetical protein
MDFLNNLSTWLSGYGDTISKYQFIFATLLVPLALWMPKIFGFLNAHLKNILFITMTIDEADNISGEGFTNFNNWLVSHRIEWLSRTFEVARSEFWLNGRALKQWTLVTGSGSQVFRFGGSIFFLTMTRRESRGQQNLLTGTFTITAFRWNRHLLEPLIEESFKSIEVYKPVVLDNGTMTGLPDFFATQRQLISKESYSEIRTVFDKFQQGEDFYFKNELTFKESILLYGPPGTGKTNLVRHIASLYQMDVVILKPGILCKQDFHRLRNVALENNGTIFLIEDIDSNSNFCRGSSGTVSSKIETENEYGDIVLVDSGERGSLSELLNGLDGIQPLHKAVVILTTNFPEKLHESIYREGRIDNHIALEYLDGAETLEYLGWSAEDPRTEVLIKSPVFGKIPAAGLHRLKKAETIEAVQKSLDKTQNIKKLKDYSQAA